MDNTGAASVTYEKPDEVNLCKVQGGPNDLFDRKTLDNVIKHGVSVLMGHNRSKTMGSLSHKNAHPFVFDNLVGAHNGTLTWPSKGRMKDDNKFDTDSEALYNDINSNGFEDTIKRMDGAWALTWYDRNLKTMNFHRNKERPLWYVLDKSGGTLYWASEHTMLYLVLNRYGIEFTGKVKAVPEDTWIRWQVNDQKGFQLDKPVHRNLIAPPFHQQKVYSTGNDYNIHCSGYDHRHSSVRRHFQNQNNHNLRPSMCTPPFVNETVVGNKTNLPAIILPGDETYISLFEKGKLDLNIYQRPSRETPGFYRLPDNTLAFKDKFEKLVDEGCIICSGVPIWTEPVKFLKDNSLVCCTCLLDTENRETVVNLIKDML